MKIILLQDVPKVGKKYEVKEVPNGLARNLLIPKRYAELAIPSALKKVELMNIKHAKKEEEKNIALYEMLLALKGKTISVKARATDEGSLFAKISDKQIIQTIKEKNGVAVPEDLVIPHEPFKKVGEYEIQLGEGQNSIPVKIVIEAE